MDYLPTNLLLDALPDIYKAALLPEFEAVSLPVRTVLYELDEEPTYVHLLTSGLASVVTGMIAGEGVEVGLVGREGFPELVHLLGPQRGGTRCFMQVAGTALRMDYKKFKREFSHETALHQLVLRNVQYTVMVLEQFAACNRLHEVEERLARWLLMASDRLDSAIVPLTQEFLAEMLGTRRSTVTIVAGIMQRSGSIEYSRGRVKLLDRAALEDTACECYAITRRLYDGLYR